MRETCHEVLKELGTKDDLLEVAMELSTSRSTTRTSSRRNSTRTSISTRYHPQSDGHSVFYVYRYLRDGAYRGLDCALERNASDGMKIARPRQLYTGYESAISKTISPVKRGYRSDKNAPEGAFFYC